MGRRSPAMFAIVASPPFQCLPRPQATTARGAPGCCLFPAALNANARPLNAKIISNAAFSFLCFPAHPHARPRMDSAKRNGARCIMLRGAQIWHRGIPTESEPAGLWQSKNAQRKRHKGTPRKKQFSVASRRLSLSPESRVLSPEPRVLFLQSLVTGHLSPSLWIANP